MGNGWDNAALEIHALLPAHSAIPREDGEVTVPFEDTWSIELGLRSRFAPGVFGNIRLQYGHGRKGRARRSALPGVRARIPPVMA